MYNELECTSTLTAIHKTEKKEEIFQYAEWDFEIKDYRPSWCTLRESRTFQTLSATLEEHVTTLNRKEHLLMTLTMEAEEFRTAAKREAGEAAPKPNPSP